MNFVSLESPDFPGLCLGKHLRFSGNNIHCSPENLQISLDFVLGNIIFEILRKQYSLFPSSEGPVINYALWVQLNPVNSLPSLCNSGKYLYLPPLWKFQLSFIHFLKFFGLTEVPSPQEIPIPSVAGVMVIFWSCTFLRMHATIKSYM